MKVEPQDILRYGALAGLIVALIGEIVEHSAGLNLLVLLGLILIISTPIATLVLISIVSLLRRDYVISILAQLSIGAIIASIIISLYR